MDAKITPRVRSYDRTYCLLVLVVIFDFDFTKYIAIQGTYMLISHQAKTAALRVTFGCKSLAADCALERPLPSVSAHVDLESASAGEWLVTYLTHVT